jgi:hypothetical protein
MNKFILAVIMMFSIFAASAGTFSGDVGVQAKVLHQGIRYDTSVVNPFVGVKFIADNGIYVDADVQTILSTKNSLQARTAVEVGYSRSFYQVYVVKYTQLGQPLANDSTAVGIKATAYGITANVENTVYNTKLTSGHDTYMALSYSTNFGDLAVNALVSGKTYSIQNVTKYNNVEVGISYPLAGTKVSVLASAGGRDAFNVKIPNQLNASVAYLF